MKNTYSIGIEEEMFLEIDCWGDARWNERVGDDDDDDDELEGKGSEMRVLGNELR